MIRERLRAHPAAFALSALLLVLLLAMWVDALVTPGWEWGRLGPVEVFVPLVLLFGAAVLKRKLDRRERRKRSPCG